MNWRTVRRKCNPALNRSTATRACTTNNEGGIAMREQIEVVYENGVFRPLGKLSGQFQEHQHLIVTVEDVNESTSWLADADPTVSLEAVCQALDKVPGTIAELVHAEREDR
jgi:predicted DNA-binding antitoxin AbrB/MazE fold protein